MKDILCQYMIECYTRGWITVRDGNISFKGANKDYYYITPASINKSKIVKDDVLKLSIKNDAILENISNLKPSGELTLHSLILKDISYENEDICIIHCHPPHILAYIGLIKTNKELSSIKEYFPELSEDIKIGPNVSHIMAKTPELGKQTYENLKGNSIVALKQHGIVAVGKTFDDIIEIIETLEYYCKIYLLSKE